MICDLEFEYSINIEEESRIFVMRYMSASQQCCALQKTYFTLYPG